MFRWLEIFLPNHYRPVEDEILADEYSLKLLEETERILDKLIEQGNKYNSNRTIRKRHLEYKIVIKIKKKKISLTIADTHLSKSKYKKRIYLQSYRKYYKTNKGSRKWIETIIQYTKNGKTYVRNVAKSPYLHAIFYKIDRLDDALIGQLIDNPVDQLSYTTHQIEKDSEIRQLYLEAKRLFTHNKQLSLDPLIENRLKRILEETEKLLPDYYLLEIEERYTIKRMLNEDIPNLLHTYLSLSVNNQLAQKENLFVSLSKMELTLINYSEKLEGLRLQKMEHIMRVNEQRYDSNS